MLVRLVNTKTSKWIFQVLHWVLPLVSLYFIFVLLNLKSQNQTLINQYIAFFNQDGIILLLGFFLLLTFLNYSTESIKWQLALKPYHSITKAESFSQTLMAFASGFITPFRSGALLSRFFSNEKVSKSQIINATISMGFAQFLATFFFGYIGLILLTIHLGNYGLLIALAAFLVATVSIISFKLNSFQRIFNWSKFQIELHWNLNVFLVSVFRYLIFSFQYLFILKSFGVESSNLFLFSLITFTFFVNTIIPSGILGKIGIRELSGIIIIGESTGFIIETSCAAFLIWMMNQALPALVGSLLHLRKIV